MSQCPVSLPSVFQKALPQVSATSHHTFVGDEGEGRDVGIGPSQPSCDSSKAHRPSHTCLPEVPESRGVTSSSDGGLCSSGLRAGH